MTLGEKQELLMRLLPCLLLKARDLGFEVRGGELLRFEEQARYNATHCRVCKQTRGHVNHVQRHKFRPIGIVKSLHRLKLAIDLLLFRKGKYCTQTEDYRELGEFWKSLDPLCRWGGDFPNPDGGHFSIAHQRRA